MGLPSSPPPWAPCINPKSALEIWGNPQNRFTGCTEWGEGKNIQARKENFFNWQNLNRSATLTTTLYDHFSYMNLGIVTGEHWRWWGWGVVQKPSEESWALKKNYGLMGASARNKGKQGRKGRGKFSGWKIFRHWKYMNEGHGQGSIDLEWHDFVPIRIWEAKRKKCQKENQSCSPVASMGECMRSRFGKQAEKFGHEHIELGTMLKQPSGNNGEALWNTTLCDG